MTGKFLLLFVLGLSSIFLQAQDSTLLHSKRSIPAVKTEAVPVIDGVLDDAVWTNASIAEDFIQFEPHPDTLPSQRSEIRLLYDDNAFYMGARLYDSAPDSIEKTLAERDEFGNSDWFGILISTYQDGINGLAFICSAAGVQIDSKHFSGGEDFSWDAVWHSAVKIDEKGWVVEMEIPYSALRFSNADLQDWDVNFVRSIRRYRERSAWNRIDPAESGLVNQSGEITGFKNIKSPIRLSLTPYLSNVLDLSSSPSEGVYNTNYTFNGGMDLKYGVNDAFTLDMTLVPDFSQVQSDNQVLNLSPFEVRFQERRPFFMEGTELFNKAGLFYSRRIGDAPSGLYDVESGLADGETIISNPALTQLYNATKFSGRNKNGLGIGLFNSVTAEIHAEIKNEEGEVRSVITEPLTNYSVVVLDQNLKNNSFITFTNTNVMRDGPSYDANVSGIMFRIRDKNNKFQVSGNGNLSQKYFDGFSDPELGHSWGLFLGKVSGNLQYNLNYYEESDTYDPNDLGFLFNNNERNASGGVSYNIFKPFGHINSMYNNVSTGYARLYEPNEFQNYWINVSNVTNFKSFNTIGGWIFLEPVDTKDWFEARVDGRVLNNPSSIAFGNWFSTDYRKKFAVDLQYGYGMDKWDDFDSRFLNFGFSPRWRISDKMQIEYDFDRYSNHNDIGWATQIEEDIIMGRRDNITTVNLVEFSWIFNNRMWLSLRVREYWSTAEYDKFYLLEQDGSLGYTEYDGLDDEGENIHNVNFNAFNVDLLWNWRFAPGSDLTIVWKNAIFQSGTEIEPNFINNLQTTFDSDQSNQLSIKLVYYLDYISLKRWTAHKS